MTEVHIDFAPLPGCTNPDTYGALCVKCNQCGRLYPPQPVIDAQTAISRCGTCRFVCKAGWCDKHECPIDRVADCQENSQ